MDVGTSEADTSRASKRLRGNYLLGVGLLLVVVFLWTISSFITQDLYEGGYEKPFLVTYLNTASFAFYLLPWAIRKYVLHRVEPEAGRLHQGYQAVAVVDALDAPTSALMANFRTPSIMSEDVRGPEDLEPLTTRQTAKLASVFCLFWFIANWTLNASLEFTSVASSTILASTSGFFTLIVGRVFRVEALTLGKIIAVFTSFVGVALVSFSDTTPIVSSDPTVEEPRLFQRAELATAVFGDALSLMSALFYAIYVVLLKYKIKEESRIDMQLFFGFVGVFNVLLLWPVGVVLHLTGAEPWTLPPSGRAWAVVLLNMFITLSSDFLYVLAMLKTTPLLVTIGLSLTIPLAIIGDYFLKIPTAPKAILGAILVIGSFILVGVESRQDVAQSKLLPGENIEVGEASEEIETQG